MYNKLPRFVRLLEGPDPPQDPQESSWLSTVQAHLPDALTHSPAFKWLVKLVSNGQPVGVSPSAAQQPQTDYNVLLGGLSGFVPYFDQAANKVVVLQQRGRTLIPPRVDQRNYTELTKDQVTWSITSNPVLQADGIPAALQEIAGPPEISSPDPAAFYLRGVHLTNGQLVVVHLAGNYSNHAFQQDINVAVIAGNVTGHTDDDAIFNKVADKFGIPPHFLYSQAYYEGGFSSKNATNFRYEPLTVDFKNLSGDDPTSTVDGNGKRFIIDPVLSPYLINGQALNNSLAPLSASFVNKAVAGTPSTLGPVFSLSGPMMATTGDPGDPVYNTSPRLMVTLTDQNGKAESISQVVSTPYTWIKGGPHCAQQNPCGGPTYYGVEMPPYIGTGPNLPPTGNQYSVDYVTGKLTFGRQLVPGETLSVTYYPVSSNQVQVTIGNAGAANLAGIKSGFAQLTFSPNQTIADWAASNLNSNDVNYQFGNFLTGTDSEKVWRFSATNTGSLSGHARPIAPLDGRFNGATAQFFAAASYGIIQVLATTLVDSRYGQGAQAAVQDPTLFPTGTFFDALNNLTAGLSLGAQYTRTSLTLIDKSPFTNGEKNLRPHTCGVPTAQITTCTTLQWEGMWSSAFHLYNPPKSAVHYYGQINDIVTNGMSHEPY
jgi:hypothetical protein